MTPPVVITLPGPPRGKERPRFVNGRAITAPNTRAFELGLGTVARAVMRSRMPLTGPLRLHIEARFAVPASWTKARRAAALAGEIVPTVKPDWDNIGKVTDALNGIVWSDDAQVADGRVVKVYAPEPATIVTVQEMRP